MSLKKVFDWSVILFIFLIPVSPFVSVRLEVLALAMSVVLRFFDGKKINLVARAWDLGIYLMVLILGLLYTTDFKTGLSVLETSFSFIGVSIILNSYEDSEAL